jgi:glycosyltransferase involved in cell wall biosynthesis
MSETTMSESKGRSSPELGWSMAAPAQARCDKSVPTSRVVDRASRGMPAKPCPSSRWVVNGRFLTQPVTGVQRYAHEVVRELAQRTREPARAGIEIGIEILAPRSPHTLTDAGDLPVTTAGFGRSHVWDQIGLWLAAGGRPILSLCGTGPLLARHHIVCIHDLNVFLAPESYSLPYRLLHRALLPLLVMRATHVVTVSHYSARRIAELGGCPEKRISVIPNGHEHMLRWDAARASPALLARLSRQFVFMLGSRARHKNTGVVLACAHALDAAGIDVVVAGGEARCFASPGGETASPNVIWLGRVTDDDLAALFQRALCFAFPSTVEGFGLPVLEAMALGCPVVVSDRASLPEVAGKAALYANPEDPAAWLTQIMALARDPQLRGALRDRGPERARLFSWRESATKYLRLLEGRPEEAASRAVRIAVGFATVGRRELIPETLAEIQRQQRLPDRVIIAPASASDCPADIDLPVPVDIVHGPKGSCAQRNTILDAATDADIVVFFDDDFFPEPAYLAEIERIMASDDSIVMVTGSVITDGILGPGLSAEAARVALYGAAPAPLERLEPTYNGYGCNMAVRMDAVRTHALRFDENLPLYAWLEDVDFSRRLAAHGRIVRSLRARGVHLGSKRARTPGLRLGYSQVANPVYLLRAGTMRADKAAVQIVRNLAANLRKARNPEPWVDRMGRLRGNWLALCDLLRGRLHPRRILDLPTDGLSNR